MVVDRCFICGEKVDENGYVGYIFMRATKSRITELRNEYGNNNLYRVYLCKKHKDVIFDIFTDAQKSLEKILNKTKGEGKWQKI